MSGLNDQAVSDIEAQIRASQEQVLKCVKDIESHNASINKVLTNLADVSKTLNKLSLFTQKIKASEPILIKVKDPLEELKKVRDEFDKDIIKEEDLEPFKKASLLVKKSFYENNPKNILRDGWIQSITFKDCENVKSVNLHFDGKDEFKFKYSIDETSNECIMSFGTSHSSRIINNTIHTSMFPISLLPYQHIYFTCEKIDETKPCNATMLYGYYDVVVPYKLCLNRIVFTIQGKKLFITKGMCVPYENYIAEIQSDYIGKIVDILSLYKDAKISATFKEIFLKIFNECLQFKGECYLFNGKMFKEAILKVRDIRWLLLEMEKYPQFFGFTEDDLEVMKNNGASRDNIYLVKKFLKKDGDYEEYHSEEEGGGIKFQYHMTGGKLDGEYKIWHKNGTLYCQDYYKEGKKEGESKRWNHDGQLVFQGYYKDDERVNEYKSWRPTGQLLEHMIYNKDGTDEYKMWYENEQLWMHTHSNGVNREGEHKRWYEDGKLMVQKFYKDGEEQGESKEWYENGQLASQGYYKDGKLEGEYKSWGKDGQLLEHIIYGNEGKIVKLKRYHNCGVLDLEKTLIENDTYELTRYYEWDGKIQDQVIMVGNKWNGEYNSWWHNGNKCTKTTYKNDKLDGEWEYWSEDGTLKEKCFYKDGEKQV